MITDEIPILQSQLSHILRLYFIGALITLLLLQGKIFSYNSRIPINTNFDNHIPNLALQNIIQ